jgi:hypothetical protein
MSTLSLSLGSRGLANIPRNEILNNFTFVVGDLYYRCPMLIADYLSPHIAKIHETDPTFCEFCVETPDPSRCFPKFLELGRGATLELDDVECALFSDLSTELGNREIHISVTSPLQDPLTQYNVLLRLGLARSMSCDCSSEIEFLAENFCDLSSYTRSKLEYSTLGAVLAHPSIVLASEDALYDCIAERIRHNPEEFDLFEHLRFEFLSVDRITAFIDCSRQNFDHFTLPLWEGLCGRLMYQIVPQSLDKRVRHHAIQFQADRPLDGVIAYLAAKCGGNVHVRDVVEITANRRYNTNMSYAEQNVADFGTPSLFHSANEPNQWICYNFKDMSVIPTYYSIGSNYEGRVNGHNLKSWVVEGSHDEVVWVPLDIQENNNDLNDRDVVRSFPVTRSVKCKMIRLRQTGKNHGGNDYLVISSFEVFGLLVE